MSTEVMGLITADEYLIDYIWPSLRRVMGEGFIWYGLLRSPSAGDDYIRRGIHPLHLKNSISENHRKRAGQWLRRISLDDPATWRIGQVDLGKHFQYEAKHFLPGSRQMRAELAHMLEWSACVALGMQTILDDIRPDVMVVWNGSQYPHAVFRALAEARGIPAFYVERGYLPGTHVMNRHGVNGRAVLPEMSKTDGEQLDQTASLIRRIVAGGDSVVHGGEAFTSEEIRQIGNVPSGKKLLLLPAQIDSDTNIILHSPVYRTNRQAIEDTIAAIRQSGTDYHLLIKPHPEDRVARGPEFKRMLGGAGSVIEGVDLDSLLRAADGVVVRNSTVGFESLLRGLPVVTLGDVLYDANGATMKARSREEMADFLGRLADFAGPAHWRNNVLPMVSHLLEQYHVFFEDQPEAFTSRRRPLRELVETGRAQAERNEREPNGACRADRGVRFEPEHISRFVRDQSGRSARRRVLVIDHTCSLRTEPAVETLLDQLGDRRIHLVTRVDASATYPSPVSVYNKESMRHMGPLLLRRYGMVVVVTHSRHLISRKVQSFARLCRAKGKYVLETTGEISDL